MAETFITKIQIDRSRNIDNFSIPLDSAIRKHLIITGKNGSGKTSLLNDLNLFLGKVEDGFYRHYESQIVHLTNLRERKKYISSLQIDNQFELQQNEQKIRDTEMWFLAFGEVKIDFTNTNDIWQKAMSGEYLIAFFDAKRQTNLTIPSGINKVEIKKKYRIQENANTQFIQYIVNLKADRSFAKDDGEMDVVEKIDKWFARFEESLKEIFDSPDLQLKFDRKNYNFDLIEKDKLPFSLNTLSSGYSAIISIVTELILRMEAHELNSYDLSRLYPI